MSQKMKVELQEVKTRLKAQFEQRYRYKLKQSNSQIEKKQQNSQSLLSPINSKSANMKKSGTVNSIQTPLKSEINKIIEKYAFKHHDNTQCLCNSCQCGRHLCNFKVQKPTLRSKSTYKRGYTPKKKQEQLIVKSQDYPLFKGNHLPMQSIYGQDFRNIPNNKIQKPRPEDQLSFQGPSLSLSTYGQLFPGYKGANQYVKPINKIICGKMTFRGRSVYSKDFQKKPMIKGNYERLPDALKTGSNWLGESTYGTSFKCPNPEAYAHRVNHVEKYFKNGDYSHQFQTNYNHEFVNKPSPICPAKHMLDSGRSALFQNEKLLLSENTDFKSFSPSFHSFATSKFAFT